jgi:D-serine deaminase-like pyridoxal phosphate-dependent protein
MPYQEQPGWALEQIDTPALIVDLDALEYNIDKLARHFAATNKTLRPHTKSHKTPAIAHRQLAAGAEGVTCAKLGEAEVMADAGIDDILIANEIVGHQKIERLMRLATRCDIMVAVDNASILAQLDAAAATHQVKPRVLVEVNIGHNRCGQPPGSGLLDLARSAAAATHLRFCGLMGYEGHVIDLEEQDARENGSRQCIQRLVDARSDLENAGLEIQICSASGTGDYYISTDFDGVTEVQAGSYALMDAAYARLDLGFKNALSVLTSVVSRPGPAQVITDAGLKSVTPEHGLPLVKDHPGLECHALSEEHGRLHRPDAADAGMAIGDLLEFIPGHGCTTVNLHDTLYAVRHGHLEEIWPIAARGKVR